jgi:putative tricarboxylic transport membrane protein
MARNAELWGGLFWLALGVFVVWSGLELGLGVLREPGSGFMVFWAGVLMLAFSGSIVGGALYRRTGPTLASLWEGTRWPKIMMVIAGILLYAVLFEQLGFVVCTLPLLLALMRLVDPVRWTVAIPTTLIATFGVWAAMTKWLKVQLPVGLLWDRLGLL